MGFVFSQIIGPAKVHPVHYLFEGENLHVLSFLKETGWRQKINTVYIDPPYNTGFSQFRKYKDKFWDYYSRERHEKWLAFMRERLMSLLPLLHPQAVVFVSIDDREMPYLNLLLREIFGENNVEMMIWNKIPSGGTAGQGKMKRSKRFRVDHEYVLVAYRDKNSTRFNRPEIIVPVQKHYDNPDNDPRGPWISGELCKSKPKSLPHGKNYYRIVTPGGRIIERQWHVSKEEFERLDADGRIWWGNGKIIPRLKKFLHEPRPVVPSSIIQNISQTEGIKDLQKFVPDVPFDNPKPVRLIKYLLEMACNPGDIVLDFFAGTGTTGQAVMELNREKKLQLQCLLASHDREGTVKKILMPRLRNYLEQTGVNEGWKYYEEK